MAYFECVVTGGGASLEVTYESDFYGKTLTATNGTKTLTKVATSSGSVTFTIPESGLWTVSGVVNNVTYSTEISISLEYYASLTAGFNYKAWLTEAGLDPTSYSSLSDVFTDQTAVRRLMLVHASADYLISAVTEDIDTIDDFCANDTAMKWIGLCDYVCDGLSAISGVWAKFMASSYWERILKDHVPTMTSNSAPYGAVSGENLQVSPANTEYYAFDRNGSTLISVNGNVNGRIIYKFTNPICVRSWSALLGVYPATKTYTLKIQGSNDGSTWEDLDTYELNNDNGNISNKQITNNKYYLYYCLYNVTLKGAGDNLYIFKLQFYGRSLNVSVPIMSGNTTPYGTAFGLNGNSATPPYQAFDGVNNLNDASKIWNSTVVDSAVGYQFPSPMMLKQVRVAGHNTTYDWKVFKIEGSNDGSTWEPLYSGEKSAYSGTFGTWYTYDVDADECYSRYRFHILTNFGASYTGVPELKFYGLDYSEKEFEAGTSRKWLYDHGLLFNGTYVANCTNDGECVVFNTSARGGVEAVIDVTDNSVLRAKVPEGTADTSDNKYISYIVRDFPVTHDLANAVFGSAYLPNNIGLDVSAINQVATLAILNMGTPNSVKVSEWWLE